MTAQAGKDMLLKIEGAPGVFTTVAGLRARTISLNARTVDATDGDSAGRWRELLAGAGVKSAAVSGQGIFRDAASDALVREAFFDQAATRWRLVVPDFGVLEGANKKRITPPFLPDQACAYIAFFLNQHQSSGAKLIEQRDWQLFFLKPDVVERLLFEAHQRDLLEYHVAGTVTRLTFPAKTLEEYADVIAQRTH
jgi:TP901-1 family phage major tail protein